MMKKTVTVKTGNSPKAWRISTGKALKTPQMPPLISHSAAQTLHELILAELLSIHSGGKFVFYFQVALLLVRTHLEGLQILAIFHPPERRLRLPRGFALPHQRIINELLDVLGFLNELRRGCTWKECKLLTHPTINLPPISKTILSTDKTNEHVDSSWFQFDAFAP